jgi:hypothetical protein
MRSSSKTRAPQLGDAGAAAATRMIRTGAGKTARAVVTRALPRHLPAAAPSHSQQRQHKWQGQAAFMPVARVQAPLHSSRGRGAVAVSASTAAPPMPVLPPSIGASAEKHRFNMRNGGTVSCAAALLSCRGRAASRRLQVGLQLLRCLRSLQTGEHLNRRRRTTTRRRPGVHRRRVQGPGADDHDQRSIGEPARRRPAPAVMVSGLYVVGSSSNSSSSSSSSSSSWGRSLVSQSSAVERTLVGPSPHPTPPTLSSVSISGACSASPAPPGCTPRRSSPPAARRTRSPAPCARPSPTTSGATFGRCRCASSAAWRPSSWRLTSSRPTAARCWARAAATTLWCLWGWGWAAPAPWGRRWSRSRRAAGPTPPAPSTLR